MQIVFNDQSDREPLRVPTSSEISQLSRDELWDTSKTLSYAIQHGSGANVKLAFPFAYCVAHMISGEKGDKKDPVNLVREIEEEGRNADLGTVTVQS